MPTDELITEEDYSRFREAMRVVQAELLSGLDSENDRKRILEIVDFRESFTSESDRGAALMAAAYLDETLSGLLRKKLVDDAKVADKAFVFNGPLGTFSSRIDFCYLLGIIPANARGDLHRIRKIRNGFAHVAGPISFENQDIRSQCDHLNFHGVNAKASPGARFRRSVMGLLGLIIFRSKDAGHLERMEDYTMPDGRGIVEFVAKVFEEKTGKEYPLRDHFD
ncbi:hypothetical protein [Pinirhizobacter soli]|uniref:hypothetical protein n=1 Tax=Pinirhizobacter soli TaxID=2786953 RepID=UPI00202A9CB9|nr:hypothetical protein [Pinirhizobacter soli]